MHPFEQHEKKMKQIQVHLDEAIMKPLYEKLMKQLEDNGMIQQFMKPFAPSPVHHIPHTYMVHESDAGSVSDVEYITPKGLYPISTIHFTFMETIIAWGKDQKVGTLAHPLAARLRVLP